MRSGRSHRYLRAKALDAERRIDPDRQAWLEILKAAKAKHYADGAVDGIFIGVRAVCPLSRPENEATPCGAHRDELIDGECSMAGIASGCVWPPPGEMTDETIHNVALGGPTDTYDDSDTIEGG